MNKSKSSSPAGANSGGRENFGNRFAIIMAMAGSAIGLGNIWRFPYMVGQYGGAAFVLVYIVCSVFLALPIFLSESVIGRSTQKNTFGALRQLFPGTKLCNLGLITIAAPLIILSYYSVVGGWSIEYLVKSIAIDFHSASISDATSEFTGFSSSSGGPVLFHTIFLASCAIVILGGVKNGIEKFNNITMPLLFVLVLLIMIYSVTLPGSDKGVMYMLKPDFGKLTPAAVAAAMGQAFFSLSLGVGVILTYSSYVSRKEDLFVSGLGTAGFDLLFAMIAGFAIMPAVFASGVEPTAGPGLIFETLPYIFAKMSAVSPILSAATAILFFVSITVAALSSAISLFEVGVAYLVEERHISRRKATFTIFLITWILGIFCALSFGRLESIRIFGLTIFSFCDILTSNFLMTFGGLLFTLLVGWRLDKEMVRNEFTNNGKLKFNAKIFPFVHFLIKYVAPVVILIVFVTSLL